MKLMNRSRKRFCVFCAVLFFVSVCFSQQTNIPHLYRYRLENGLELFVAENSSAPLAYIEIAFRTGAVSQTPETAGLFHLYEHMLFKGNARYANQKESLDALNAIGVIDRNGTTGVDRVNYFFTLPSSQLREGLAFWSYAVRTPKLGEQELENEKSVVLSEINAAFTDNSRIRSAGLFKALFPESPWKLDAGGSPAVVASASAESLRRIQHEYYIPENAALFVGGDVHHEEVFRLVKEIYGPWKNQERADGVPALPAKTPSAKTQKLVFVDSGSSDGVVQASFYLRGPDGGTEPDETYTADVWSTLINNPSGKYIEKMLAEKTLSIPDSSGAGGFYATRRASGMIGFYAYMMNDGAISPVEKADGFLSCLQNELIPDMARGTDFFGDSLALVIRQLEDSRIYQLENVESLLSSLSYSWSSCSSDYFFDYDSRIADVTPDDIGAFVEKYLVGKSGVLLVTVSPEVWRKYSREFQNSGFVEITAANAFWQNDIRKQEEVK